MENRDNNLLNICSPIEKGYYDERAFFLSLMKYNFIGNNLVSNNYGNLEEYKKNIGKGSDFKLKVNNKTIEIEKKYLSAKCYRSWVLRDYLPRFSYLPNTIPIVVVSNKWNISYAGRKLLSEYHVKVFSDYEFAYWLVNYHRKHKHPNKYILNLVEDRCGNLSENVEEDNLLGKSEAKSSKSRVFSENSKAKTKGDSQSKLNEHRNNYDINDETMFKPIEPKRKYPPKPYLVCYRCGSKYSKETGSRFFCNNCLPYAKDRIDKEKHLWHYTKEFYEKRYGIQIECELCKKPIGVLEDIVSRGQRLRHWYHASCWERLIGIEDSEPKETITVLFNGKEITEVI
jgi:hypothetical protein